MTSRKNYAPYILRAEGDLTTAKCVSCLKEKTYHDYYRHSFKADGLVRYRQICKDCRRVKKKAQKSRPVFEKIIKDNKQKCSKCKEVKSLDFFYSNGCFADGLTKYRSKCKNCVLNDLKQRHESSYEKKIKIRHASYKNYISSLLNHSSKRRFNDFNLDIQYLLDMYESQKGLCAISGVKMTYEHNAKTTNISIDRIDSKIGYVKGNINLVCYIVNIMKQSFTKKDFIDFCEKIVDYNKNIENV